MEAADFAVANIFCVEVSVSWMDWNCFAVDWGDEMDIK